jgi:hypothetical protein
MPGGQFFVRPNGEEVYIDMTFLNSRRISTPPGDPPICDEIAVCGVVASKEYGAATTFLVPAGALEIVFVGEYLDVSWVRGSDIFAALTISFALLTSTSLLSTMM